MRLQGGGLGSPETGGRQVEFVSLVIKSNGAGAALSGKCLRDHEMLRIDFMHDGQSPLAIGAEYILRLRVELRAVDSRARSAS